MQLAPVSAETKGVRLSLPFRFAEKQNSALGKQRTCDTVKSESLAYECAHASRVAQIRHAVPFRFADAPQEKLVRCETMGHQENTRSGQRRSLAWLARAVAVAQSVPPWVSGRSILPKCGGSLLQRLLPRLRTFRLHYLQYEEDLKGYAVGSTEVEVVDEATPHWRKVIGWAMSHGMERPEAKEPLNHRHHQSVMHIAEGEKRTGGQQLRSYIKRRC